MHGISQAFGERSVKPVAQLIDSGEDGDCFRACVASILELDPLDLPNVGDPAVAKGRYHVAVMNETQVHARGRPQSSPRLRGRS